MKRHRLQLSNPAFPDRAYSRPIRRSGPGPVRLASRVLSRGAIGIQLQSSPDLANWLIEGEWRAAQGLATFAEVRPAAPWLRACAWPEEGTMVFDAELLERDEQPRPNPEEGKKEDDHGR